MDGEMEDLYDDLIDPSDQQQNASPKAGNTASNLHEQMDELRARLAAVIQERDELATSKNVLLRNISCLYKTAVAELERKDTTIRNLHAQLASDPAARRKAPRSRDSPPPLHRAYSSSAAPHPLPGPPGAPRVRTPNSQMQLPSPAAHMSPRAPEAPPKPTTHKQGPMQDIAANAGPLGAPLAGPPQQGEAVGRLGVQQEHPAAAQRDGMHDDVPRKRKMQQHTHEIAGHGSTKQQEYKTARQGDLQQGVHAAGKTSKQDENKAAGHSSVQPDFVVVAEQDEASEDGEIVMELPPPPLKRQRSDSNTDVRQRNRTDRQTDRHADRRDGRDDRHRDDTGSPKKREKAEFEGAGKFEGGGKKRENGSKSSAKSPNGKRLKSVDNSRHGVKDHGGRSNGAEKLTRGARTDGRPHRSPPGARR